MKKLLKKNVLLSLILVICISVCIVLSACATDELANGEENGHPRILASGVFNTVNLSQHENNVRDITNTYGQNKCTSMTFVLHDSARVNVDIADMSGLKEEIHYTTDDYSTLPNTIVTSKWVYCYYLLAKQWGDKFSMDDDAVVKCMNDKICWERNCLNVYSMPNFDDYTNTDYEFLIAFRNKFAFYADILPAAMQRYGVIDFDSMHKGIAPITISFKYNTDDTNNFIYKSTDFNIVGYYETEADKLLSTGVSMDVESEEYKFIHQNVSNHTFYSTQGEITLPE